MKKRIKILHKALIEFGSMEYGLYEYELEEHLDYWKKSMYRDNNDFIFVVTEMDGHVAMLLINDSGELFINEKARKRLQLYWKVSYEENIKFMLPFMAKQLSNGILSVNGVKVVNN